MATIDPREEQDSAKTRENTAHAEKWYADSRHLFDIHTQSKIDAVIKQAKMGRLTHGELNYFMKKGTKGVYQEPDAPPFSIPDHLSDQFIRDMQNRA